MKVQNQIEQKLRQGLKLTHLEVINESHQHHVPKGSETHFRVVAVSEEFSGLSRIQRQRKINELLKEELEGPVHALSQRALSPEEWEQEGRQDRLSSPACHKKPL